MSQKPLHRPISITAQQTTHSGRSGPSYVAQGPSQRQRGAEHAGIVARHDSTARSHSSQAASTQRAFHSNAGSTLDASLIGYIRVNGRPLLIAGRIERPRGFTDHNGRMGAFPFRGVNRGTVDGNDVGIVPIDFRRFQRIQ